MTCLTVCKTLTISQTSYRMLENDHPGSIGKILKNLLAKVEESSLELALPEKLPVLRAGSIFTYPINDTQSPNRSDSEYGGLGITSSLRSRDESIMQKEALTAVKDCKFLFCVMFICLSLLSTTKTLIPPLLLD